MDTTANLGRRVGDRAKPRREHFRALLDALRAVDDTEAIATDAWRDAKHHASRTYLLDVAGLTVEDLDAETVRWLDWLVRRG